MKGNGISVQRRTGYALPKRRYIFAGLQPCKIAEDRTLQPPLVSTATTPLLLYLPTCSPKRKLLKATPLSAINPHSTSSSSAFSPLAFCNVATFCAQGNVLWASQKRRILLTNSESVNFSGNTNLGINCKRIRYVRKKI